MNPKSNAIRYVLFLYIFLPLSKSKNYNYCIVGCTHEMIILTPCSEFILLDVIKTHVKETNKVRGHEYNKVNSKK